MLSKNNKVGGLFLSDIHLTDCVASPGSDSTTRETEESGRYFSRNFTPHYALQVSTQELARLLQRVCNVPSLWRAMSNVCFNKAEDVCICPVTQQFSS